MEKKKEKVNYFIKMEKNMRAFFILIKDMEKENYFIKMVILNMMEIF